MAPIVDPALAVLAANDEPRNLGLIAPEMYLQWYAFEATILLGFICNKGPYGGNVPKIDQLFTAQGQQLNGAGPSSLRLGNDYYGRHGEHVAVIGYYDFKSQLADWVVIFNVPNTGPGGPRGTIRVSRGLQEVRGDGWQSINLGGRGTRIVVHYREDDATAGGIVFRFSSA